MTDAPTTDAPVVVDNVEQARHLIAELSAPDAADTLADGSLIVETVAALEALIGELELAQADTHAGRLADIVTKWADPEPGMLSKLPKPTRKENPKGRCDVCRGYHGLPAVHLDYMGHADVTEALIDADPFWNWRPAAIDHNTGGPVIVREKMATMWGYLTVLGVERMCVGTADGGKEEYAKELIGDLLRNGAMRFGIGLRLWSKADHLDATGDADNELAATTGVVDRSQPTEPPAQRARQDRADDARAQVAGELLAAGAAGDRAPGEGRADLEAVANTGPLKNKAIRMARPLAAAAGIDPPGSFAELLEMDAVAGAVAVLLLEDLQKGS